MTTNLVSRLTGLEAVIETAIEQIYEGWTIAGRALREIQRDKLYKPACDRFGDYVQERWHIKRSTAYEWIRASQTAENFSQIDPPKDIQHALELSRLPDDIQEQAYREAREAGNGHVSRLLVQSIVESKLDPSRPIQTARDYMLDDTVDRILRLFAVLDTSRRQIVFSRIHEILEREGQNVIQ